MNQKQQDRILKKFVVVLPTLSKPDLMTLKSHCERALKYYEKFVMLKNIASLNTDPHTNIVVRGLGKTINAINAEVESRSSKKKKSTRRVHKNRNS